MNFEPLKTESQVGPVSASSSLRDALRDTLRELAGGSEQRQEDSVGSAVITSASLFNGLFCSIHRHHFCRFDSSIFISVGRVAVILLAVNKAVGVLGVGRVRHDIGNGHKEA